MSEQGVGGLWLTSMGAASCVLPDVRYPERRARDAGASGARYGHEDPRLLKPRDASGLDRNWISYSAWYETTQHHSVTSSSC